MATDADTPAEATVEEKKKLNLSVKVDKKSACERHVTVTIPREDIDRYIKESFDKLKGKAEVPGFRPGRAPRKLVEARFKDSVRDQVKGSLLMDSMAQLSDDQVFTAISEPDFDVEAVVLPEDGPLMFEFNIEVRPEFDLPRWQGIRLDRLAYTPSDADVTSHLERILSKFAHKEPIEAPAAANDFLTVNIEVRSNGEVVSREPEVELTVKSKLSFADATIEGFDTAVIGAVAGDHRVLKATISENADNEALRGKEVEVDLEVLDVKRMIYPELTPEFLEEIGGFESESELRDLVRTELERQFKFHQQRAVRKQITAQLTATAAWDLPPAMLRRQSRRELERLVLELRSSGFDDEQISQHSNEIRQNSLAATNTALKEHFILERIAEEEKIEAEPQDYETEIELIAEQSDEPPRRVRARLEKKGLMDSLRNQIIERKVIELITSHAVVVDVPHERPMDSTCAVDVALSGDEPEDAIPEAKHGGDAAPIPNSTENR